MTKADLIEKLCTYARTNMASKATSKATQFVLGAISSGIGKKIIESKLSPIFGLCTDENGNIKWDEVKASIISGFNTSNSVPVLGGVISVDVNDANDFFSFVESSNVNTNSCNASMLVNNANSVQTLI